MSATHHQQVEEQSIDALADDPTKTVTLRRTYARKLRGALDRIRAAMRVGIVDRDVFGLQSEALAVRPPRNFSFKRNAGKEEGFDEWWDLMAESNILRVYGEDNQYIERAYQRGMKDANTQIRRSAFIEGDPLNPERAIRLPAHRDTVESLYVRNYRQLNGLTADVGSDMSRVLSEGFARGEGPRTIASDLADIIGKVEDGTPTGAQARATRIARTEVMNANNEARVTQFERFDVDLLEVLTAGDPCDRCVSIAEGSPYPPKEAHALLPGDSHPNCRCTWTLYRGNN